MKSGKHISHLLGCNWLVEENQGKQLLFASFLRIMQGGDFSGDDEEEKAFGGIVAPGSVKEERFWNLSSEEIPDGSIAIIDIRGPIVKYGNWAYYGSDEYIRWTEQAAENSRIKAIIYRVDSPGGMVDGTQSLAQAIKKVQKPTYTWVHDGMMASAAYWVGSSVNNGVYASLGTDTIGSVGVYLTLADIAAYFKSIGLPIHEIYADQSSEKNKAYREALKKNYKPIKTEVLNPIAETFIEAVQENRGSKLSVDDQFDWTKGGTRMASIAENYGLIDGILTFEELIENINGETATLSTTVNFNSNSKSNNDMKLTFANVKKFVQDFFGISAEKASETEVTAEHVDKLATEVENQKAANSQLKDENSQLKADLQKEHDGNVVLKHEKSQLAEANTQLTGELATAKTAVSDKEKEITALNEKLTATEKERDDQKALAEEYGAKSNAEKKASQKTSTDESSHVEGAEGGEFAPDPESSHMKMVKELDGQVN